MTRLNVLLHEMVPDHQIMTGEEVTELLKTFDISEDQLPKIYHDDPAIKACSGKPGNVIRIIRKTNTMICSLFFRPTILPNRTDVGDT